MIGAHDVIKLLGLKPLKREGGYYRETYRSSVKLGKRSLATAIFYLLTPEVCSNLHRLNSDEIYHFYLGDPIELLMLFPDTSSRIVRMGSNILEGHQLQFIVPAGTWQGAYLVGGGRWALLGTTMAPGFDWDDYEQGSRAWLVSIYPERRQLIEKLTDLEG